MNRDQILSVVETAIANRPPSGSGKWFLCFKDGEIKARPTCLIPMPEAIFHTFTEYQAETGFNSQVWGKINTEIFVFLRQKGLI